MQKLKDSFKELQLLDKIRMSEKRGIIIGMLIAAGIIALVTVAIVKYLWMKKQFDGLCYDLDDLYDDEDFDEEAPEEEKCCEDECCVASEKELEKI